MIRGRSVLTITNEIAYLPAVQSFARECARETGFGKADQEMILLALEEAVTNVIEHAFESAGEPFQIIFEPSPTGIRIIVKDTGLPYDPRHTPGYEAPTGIEETLSGGLGSFIMGKAVDEVSFCNLGRKGKELHLVKYLPARSVVGESAPPEAESGVRPARGDAGFTSPPVFHIRPMESSEALEVSRLFYRAYGYSYVSDVMYYPERLAELNREGLITSVIAVTDQGEIAGHLAMARESAGDDIAEMGKGAVKPRFRGHDVFTEMQKLLNVKAKTMGIRGIYGRAVSAHSATQKMANETGYRDCGVVLGAAPADLAFKGIADKLSQRESYVYSFQPLVALPSTAVYPPPHHEAMVRRIYENLGIAKDFRTPRRAARLKDRSEMQSKVYPDIMAADIVISRYGKDCLPVLQDLLKDLCAKKVEYISLFLNLGDPLTARMCKEIEKLGFFFAGAIPCLRFEDTLILQYLNNVIMDYGRINLHSDMAKEIGAYIKESRK